MAASEDVEDVDAARVVVDEERDVDVAEVVLPLAAADPTAPVPTSTPMTTLLSPACHKVTAPAAQAAHRGTSALLLRLGEQSKQNGSCQPISHPPSFPCSFPA